MAVIEPDVLAQVRQMAPDGYYGTENQQGHAVSSAHTDQADTVSFSGQTRRGTVITLIMLGMVTAMAVVFLSISRRERASMSVITDRQEPVDGRDRHGTGALKVVSRMVTTQNPLAYGLSFPPTTSTALVIFQETCRPRTGYVYRTVS